MWWEATTVLTRIRITGLMDMATAHMSEEPSEHERMVAVLCALLQDPGYSLSAASIRVEVDLSPVSFAEAAGSQVTLTQSTWSTCLSAGPTPSATPCVVAPTPCISLFRRPP